MSQPLDQKQEAASFSKTIAVHSSSCKLGFEEEGISVNQQLSPSPCTPSPWPQPHFFNSSHLPSCCVPPILSLLLCCTPEHKTHAYLWDPNPPHHSCSPPWVSLLPSEWLLLGIHPKWFSKQRHLSLSPHMSCNPPASWTYHWSCWSRRERLQRLSTNMGNFLQAQALQWVAVSAVSRVLIPHTTSRTSLCLQSSKLLLLVIPLPKNSLSSLLSS